MDVVFGLIPMMLLFGFLVVVVFIWMAKSGQFDDLDGAANSIFMDDEFDEELKKKEADDESEPVEGRQESASGGGEVSSPSEIKPSRHDAMTEAAISDNPTNTPK